MRRLALFFFALLLSLTPLACAAGFDCAKASTPREHTICATPALSRLDSKLSVAYISARGQLSPAAAGLVRSDEQEWLHQLDSLCPSSVTKDSAPTSLNCITEQYNERITQLTQGFQHRDGITFYPRLHLKVVHARPGDDREDTDPSYGYGSFTWPQIDNPTPGQQAWNEAVLHRLIQLSAGRHGTTLDDGADPSGTIDTYYDIRAANQSLVDVDLTVSTYSWGAAHPLTATSSFAFWLDKDRPLALSDLFKDSSHWKSGLVDVVIAKLMADDGEAGMFWDHDEFRKAVAAGIAEPTSWDVSRHDLTIRFGQYAVAAYAAGMPEATFTWPELHAFLNPALNPAQLPAASTKR